VGVGAADAFYLLQEEKKKEGLIESLTLGLTDGGKEEKKRGLFVGLKESCPSFLFERGGKGEPFPCLSSSSTDVEGKRGERRGGTGGILHAVLMTFLTGRGRGEGKGRRIYIGRGFRRREKKGGGDKKPLSLSSQRSPAESRGGLISFFAA